MFSKIKDYDFHSGKSEYEDIIQSDHRQSHDIARGHQGPAAYLILASGLDKVIHKLYLSIVLFFNLYISFIKAWCEFKQAYSIFPLRYCWQCFNLWRYPKR